MSFTIISAQREITCRRSRQTSLPSATTRRGEPRSISPASHNRAVRDYFIHNALYWLEEYHFDGLRFDAVHAIYDDSHPDIIAEIGETIRRQIPDREIHLVLENDRNEARRLTRRNGRPECFTAQWNDDLHHALHVLITGETAGYYQDYAADPAASLARALAEGFAYQGEPSPFRDGQAARRALRRSAANRFCRPFCRTTITSAIIRSGPASPRGRRRRRCMPAWRSCCCHPKSRCCLWARNGPVSARSPFSAILNRELAESVREGRRREFAHFPEFGDDAARERLPDPTAKTTFEMSKLDWDEPSQAEHAIWLARYRHIDRTAHARDCAASRRDAGPCRFLSATRPAASHCRMAARLRKSAAADGEFFRSFDAVT